MDDELTEDLLSMAEDLQIGGDAGFRGMANAVKLLDGRLKMRHKRHMHRLLRRGEKLLHALHQFWDDHPDLNDLIDRGAVLASDGLTYADRKREKTAGKKKK